MEDILQDHWVKTILGALAGAALMALKDYKDRLAARAKLRDLEAEAQAAALRYETLRLGFQTELLADQKKRLTGRSTPTGVRIQTVKRELRRTFPGVDPRLFDRRIEQETPVVQSIFAVAHSMPPPAHADMELPEFPRPPTAAEFPDDE